jgi:aryl-alcohol dehydrogenase-like predicted oxidoreductase
VCDLTGICTYQAIERGLLTNKVLQDYSIEINDIRRNKSEFEDEKRNVIARWVKEYLAPIAYSSGIPISNLAIWWVLRQKGVQLCLFGAKSQNQVIENMAAADVNLPATTIDVLNESYVSLSNEIQKRFSVTVREFLGLANYDYYKNSNPSGKINTSA